MKKNLISVIILALVLANFVLTALLIFSVLPETNKANEMIEKVCSAIDLELNSGAGTGISNIPIEQIESYQVKEGEQLTINLRSEDDAPHYALIAVSLSLNTKSDNYKKYPPTDLAEKDDIIRNDIIQIIGNYTLDEFNSNREAIRKEILEDMQGLFGGDYVVAVNFSDVTTS